MRIKSLFKTKEVVVTPQAHEKMQSCGQNAMFFLIRHVRGDGGEALSEEGQAINDAAVKNGNRIMSAYELLNGEVLWVMTDAVGDDGERAVTTILLPEEY